MKIKQVKLTKDDIYNRVLASAVKDTRITGDEYRLYSYLYNVDGELFSPTEKAMATVMNVDERTIKRWIQDLKYYGYVYTKGTRNNVTLWITTKPNNKPYSSPKTRVKHKTKGAQMSLGKGAQMSQL